MLYNIYLMIRLLLLLLLIIYIYIYSITCNFIVVRYIYLIHVNLFICLEVRYVSLLLLLYIFIYLLSIFCNQLNCEMLSLIDDIIIMHLSTILGHILECKILKMKTPCYSTLHYYKTALLRHCIEDSPRKTFVLKNMVVFL